jgi:hypothetical protein
MRCTLAGDTRVCRAIEKPLPAHPPEDPVSYQSLRNYSGKVDIFAASDDRAIPNKHAKNLAASIKGARYVEFVGEHNAVDWVKSPQVVFTIK